jgi:hypothetical protein
MGLILHVAQLGGANEGAVHVPTTPRLVKSERQTQTQTIQKLMTA